MAQQYTTGSVTVTASDATVTGTGTDWQNAGITTGDWLIVQGDSIGYRVNSVTSNTELELSEPYAGTTGTYSDYAISREFTPNLALVEMSPKSIGSAQAYNESMGIIDQEVGNRYTKTEADARYLQEASNLSDLDSASTARGNLGLGTAAVADTTTSPTDTTAGRVPLLPYAYTRANILGTVSQSGGTPTGAIFETGKVGDWTYIKYANGLMEQFAIVDIAVTSGGTSGTSETPSLPEDYTDANFKVFSVVEDHGGVSFSTWAYVYRSTPTNLGQIQVSIIPGNNSSWDANGTIPVNVMTRGFWF